MYSQAEGVCAPSGRGLRGVCMSLIEKTVKINSDIWSYFGPNKKKFQHSLSHKFINNCKNQGNK